MESPLKERLTGALIVVAVLVIVVPEMLSGPDKPEATSRVADDTGPPVRTYSLELGTPTAARTQDQSSLTPQSSEPPVAATAVAEPEVASQAPVAAAPAQAAATAAEAPSTAATVPSPVAASPAPAPALAPADVKPAPAAVPDPPATPAKGQWWAQLGSFSARDNAERLSRELRGKGYSVTVARIKVGGKDLYRVRSGPVASRDAAVALQARLAAAGHKSSLVAP